MMNIPVLERLGNDGKQTGCRFSKPFQSDNHVYCDLNNSTLDVFI